jgi:hypothetical protein
MDVRYRLIIFLMMIFYLKVADGEEVASLYTPVPSSRKPAGLYELISLKNNNTNQYLSFTYRKSRFTSHCRQTWKSFNFARFFSLNIVNFLHLFCLKFSVF